MATTVWPGSVDDELPSASGCSWDAGTSTWITAVSVDLSLPTRVALAVEPSWNLTLIELAPLTTCSAVMMSPFVLISKPVPSASSFCDPPGCRRGTRRTSRCPTTPDGDVDDARRILLVDLRERRRRSRWTRPRCAGTTTRGRARCLRALVREGICPGACREADRERDHSGRSAAGASWQGEDSCDRVSLTSVSGTRMPDLPRTILREA